jgi:hypothetical protein
MNDNNRKSQVIVDSDNIIKPVEIEIFDKFVKEIGIIW